MAFFLSPIGNTQTIDANGDPLIGGTIETYLAGTSTARTTYTSNTGATPQGVVMTLNSIGYPTNGPVWMIGGVPLKFIIKDALGVVQSTFDNVSGIGDTSTGTGEWTLYGATPTYVSATSFSVAGDQTNTFQPLRRLQSVNSGGTVYGTVSTAVFSAGVTTVTVTNTSGVLDSGMSSVSYGPASNNPSIPAIYPMRGFLAGLGMSTAGSSATMTIAAGTAVDSTNVIPMNLLSAIAKTTSAWAVGTAAGGLDTGAIANNTGYHFFLIRRPDTGVVDVLISLSATAPTLPASYTQFRRIGWGRTNGSAQWTSFIQDGDYFQWAAPTVDINVSSSGTAAVTRTLTVPTGVNVRAVLNCQMAAGGSGEILYVSDLATTDLAPTSSSSSPINTMFTFSSQTLAAQIMVRTNTSGQIRTRQAFGGATETFRAAVIAWFDDRGRSA